MTHEATGQSASELHINYASSVTLPVALVHFIATYWVSHGHTEGQQQPSHN